MSLFQQAAHLNNEGISALISGNYQIGVDTLTKAIMVLKYLLTKAETDLKGLKSSSSSKNFSTVELSQQKQQPQDVYFFNEAFQISEDVEVTATDIHVYTAAVIFNLALAHHNHCCINNNNDPTTPDYYQNNQIQQVSSKKARRLYTMTLKLMQNQAWQNHQTASLLRLACINNLFLSQTNDCDTYDYLYCMAIDTIRQLSNISHRQCQNRTDGLLVDESKLQGILINFVILKPPKVAAAA